MEMEERMCEDKDGDGYGDPDTCVDPADAGPQWVGNDGDCDDGNEYTYPGAAEAESSLCAKDEDADGYGDDDPINGVDAGADCDDTAIDTHPGAAEQEDGLCARDRDDDGWGDEDPKEGVDLGRDCDDGDANTHPGAAEAQDELCAKDGDGDGWGDHDPPVGVDPGGDCDDTNDEVSPDSGNIECYDTLVLTVTRNLSIDAGDEVQLIAEASGGSGSYDWWWEPGESLDSSGVSDPFAHPERSTTYEVSVEDDVAMSSAAETVTVHVSERPLDLTECEVWQMGLDIEDLDTDEWEYEESGEGTCQAKNADPSALICNVELYDARVAGEIHVHGVSDGEETDNDWHGLVWGVQDDGPFYLFSWKGEGQTHSDCGDTVFSAGMRVKLIEGWSDLSCDALVGDFNNNESELLLGPGDIDGGDQVWKPEVEYSFELEHAPDGSTLKIRGSDGLDTEIFVADTSILSGRFGYFHFSQSNACFERVWTQAND